MAPIDYADRSAKLRARNISPELINELAAANSPFRFDRAGNLEVDFVDPGEKVGAKDLHRESLRQISLGNGTLGLQGLPGKAAARTPDKVARDAAINSFAKFREKESVMDKDTAKRDLRRRKLLGRSSLLGQSDSTKDSLLGRGPSLISETVF